MAVVRGRDSGRVHPLVLAGGSDLSLWPMVRRARPKPFVDLFGDGPLICGAVRRASRMARRDDVVVVADPHAAGLLSAMKPPLGYGTLIAEPLARGSAGAVALGAAMVVKLDPEGVLLVMPSDHLILDEGAFLETAGRAVLEASRTDALICIAIRPKHASSAYGYIQKGDVGIRGAGEGCWSVRSFAEKPDYATAARFIEGGGFFWNSGIFACRVEILLEAFREAMPDWYRDMLDLARAMGGAGERIAVARFLESIHPASIDTAVLERVANVGMIEGVFGWCDPGNWDEVVGAAVERAIFSGEHQEYGVVGLPEEGLFVRKPHGKAVCVLGHEGMVVIDTGDALLICPAGESYRIHEALERLGREGMEPLL